MSSVPTRALTIAAALCGFAFARPTTVYAPTTVRPRQATLLHGLEVPTESYLDVGAARSAAQAATPGYVAAPAPWQVEPGPRPAPAPDRERRYLDVGALGLVREPTDPPAR